MIMYDVKYETMNDPCDERKEKHLHQYKYIFNRYFEMQTVKVKSEMKIKKHKK